MENSIPQPTSLSDVKARLPAKSPGSTDPRSWETLREFCVVSMQRHDLLATERLEFAKAALEAISKKRQAQGLKPIEYVAEESWVRAYAISEFGPDPSDPVRDPKTAANAILSNIGEDFQEISELSERWYEKGIDTIRRLRRVKNFVKPLEPVIPHLAVGTRERADAEDWLSLWPRLP
ncbi:hypothetical protein GCM10010420_47930 [Streptomyces glaucosporus]|uniref:Uncharacterized protein n=1 Tax=Streptomyces glaucosporus TaxID=284044 RepID=A0ABN3IST6_9ACTN